MARMRSRDQLLLFIYLLVSSYGAGANEYHQKQVTPMTVWAELDGDVTLPCDISSPSQEKINMILWFKESSEKLSNGFPIYSFDARNYSNVIHMAMSHLEKRCSFISSGSKRGSLKIQKVTKQDAGIYKCRIDFPNSPTQYFKVIVVIADIPSTPVIQTSDGTEVGYMVGPLREDELLDLKCSVNDGNPTPRLSWWLNEEQLRGVTKEYEMKVHSHLVIHSLSRYFNAKLLKCRVNVTGVSKTFEKLVRLDVHVKPLQVSILHGNTTVTDGESAKFLCDCYGSNPPAVVNWLLEGEAIRSSAITVTQSSNTTSSTLTIRIDPFFNNKSLLCKCENPEFPGFYIDDKKILQVHCEYIQAIIEYTESPKLEYYDVVNQSTCVDIISSNYYKPLTQINTRPKYIFNKIREGENLSLECNVDANPPANLIQWYRNGKLIDSESKTIYNMKNITLDLQGEYECEAINKEGRSRSSKLMVNILYAPFCQEGSENHSIIASVHETVILHCEVETGFTNKHVKFFWSLNGTAKIESVSNDRIQSAGNVSILKYTPETEDDFGTIACWSQNDVGLQKVPCYFYLTLVNKPSRPKNCDSNSTKDMLKITCDAGSDGGLTQYFILEVRHANLSSIGGDMSNEISSDQPYEQVWLMNQRTRKVDEPLRRMRKEKPVFDIYDLESDLPYIFTLYAVNLRGRSEPTFLTKIPKTAKNIVSSEMSAQQDVLIMPSIYIIIMASILLIASLVIMMAIILACRSRGVIRRENVNELNNFRIAYSDQSETDKRMSNYESEF